MANLHLKTGFWRVLVNGMSPLNTEPINFSTSSSVISPKCAANFPFRRLYATSTLSDFFNSPLSNAFRNDGCLVASTRA